MCSCSLLLIGKLSELTPDFAASFFRSSQSEISAIFRAFMQFAEELVYNPNGPIETSDLIIADECNRSMYNLWRQVLEYFDAYLIGLTATPSKQTIGFFNKNLVMEYGHERAVADQVNVNSDVYKIDTEITKGGNRVEKGFYVDKRDRLQAKAA